MSEKIDKGRSILNATDEAENPYGLVLSEVERDFIYGQLNKLDKVTGSLLEGRTGWRPQLKAAITAAAEIVGVGFGFGLVSSRHSSADFGAAGVFFAVLAFLILWKLNLLLTHETVDQMIARQDRQEKKEAQERARYFKDMGCKDLSTDE